MSINRSNKDNLDKLNEQNSKSKVKKGNRTGKGRSSGQSNIGKQRRSNGRSKQIISITNYDMMMSLNEALHNSGHINDETYSNIKKLLKEEVKD